jgi:hypothetical protein
VFKQPTVGPKTDVSGEIADNISLNITVNINDAQRINPETLKMHFHR